MMESHFQGGPSASSSSRSRRIVALVDMDCFYVQVEERDNPDIKGVPAAVVQYKTYKGGGIIAVNYEARAWGVSRNMRGDDATVKCPEIILVRVPETRGKADLTKYRDAGKEVIDVLAEFSSCVERASIDEAYIDLTKEVDSYLSSFVGDQEALQSLGDATKRQRFETNFVLGYDSTASWLSMISESDLIPLDDLRLAIGAEIVGRMRDAVLEKTGFKCSAGIAHNKVIAKLCAGLNKPNKQTVLPHQSVGELWRKTKIGKVRGLGGKLGDLLVQQFKCDAMSDLLPYSEKELSKHVGIKAGNWIYHLVRGYDDEVVNPRQLAKSIGCNKNFFGPAALTTKEKVKHWLEQLTAEVVERIQKDYETNHRKAKTLTLYVTFEEQNSVSKACKIHPQYNSDKVMNEVWTTMDKLYKDIGQLPINMLGLVASRFEEESEAISTSGKISSFFETTSDHKPSASILTLATSSSNCNPAEASSSVTPSCSTKKPSTSNTLKDPALNNVPVTPTKKGKGILQWASHLETVEVSPSKQPVTQECDRCGQPVPVMDYISHVDHHVARDLSREINGLPPLGFDLRPETLEANERARAKEKTKMNKDDNNKAGKRTNVFKRKNNQPSPRKKSKVLVVNTIDTYFNKTT